MLDVRGLICWRTSRRGKVGVFCVSKKDAVTKLPTQLRLIFDCRQPDAMCQEPPTTTLSTGGSIASMRLPSRDEPTNDERPYEGRSVCADLENSFYQFLYRALSDLFGIGDAYNAHEYGVDYAFDDDDNL